MRLQHVVSSEQFSDSDMLSHLFCLAEDMERRDATGTLPSPLAGTILASLFYEPSTRTRFSFEAAALKLGGHTLTTENAMEFSSAIKGETLADSIRVVGGYANMIVLRHPEKGAAARAARVSPVPLINAGDGAGEHPTQALLDLYTIRKARGGIAGATIALVGDLRHGRTIHSLLRFMPLFPDVRCILVSPEALSLPEDMREWLSAHQVAYESATTLEEVLEIVDVLYMTRVQKERFASSERYESLKQCFVLSQDSLKHMKSDAVIMHPLPRNSEIHPDVDADARAWYFKQAHMGLYVRMALLAALAEGLPLTVPNTRRAAHETFGAR